VSRIVAVGARGAHPTAISRRHAQRSPHGPHVAVVTGVRVQAALALLLLGGCLQPAASEGDAFDDRCEEPTASIDALSSISCGSHTDTGYRSGSSFTITVVTVDGHPVERETANAYYVMAQAAARDGVEIRIVSGFRTMAEQEHLYYCYTSCSCNDCNLAARPGYSNHQSGHALDLNTSSGGVYSWLSRHGGAYGFSRTVPSEAWHWEWWGGGPGGGPCVVARDDDGDGSLSTADCDDHDARRTPGRAETCDGIDNDCDSAVDDHLVRSCGTDVGECVAGTSTCGGGSWGACVGSVDPAPEVCDRLDNDCDGETDDEQVCEREEALLGPGIYGPTLDSDVSGDGLPDACARTHEGFSCLIGSGHGFQRQIIGPALDGLGVEGAARLRMADVDGDGRADVCAIDEGRLRCWPSTGDAFGAPIAGPVVGEGVTSIELADVDGDTRIDACLRDAQGLSCWLATAHGFERLVTLGALSDAGGFADVVHHGTLRFGDVDGDGRTDVCARDASGVDCWLATGDGFGARIRGPRWSDASGFDALDLWSTIRLVDVDGDAASDLCARTPAGFRCVLSVGAAGFGDEITGPPMASADGWSEAAVYSTLRMADVDGDGATDVCAREPDRVRCWLFDGHAFDRVVLGPALPASEGWDRAAAYRSVRFADVDGDGRADLCARSSDALRCYVSTGGGFDRVWVTPEWGDASGLGGLAASASIRLAIGPASTTTSDVASSALGCSVSMGRRSAPPATLVLFGLALLARRKGSGASSSRRTPR
jgi:hypothetical protein